MSLKSIRKLFTAAAASLLVIACGSEEPTPEPQPEPEVETPAEKPPKQTAAEIKSTFPVSSPTTFRSSRVRRRWRRCRPRMRE